MCCYFIVLKKAFTALGLKNKIHRNLCLVLAMFQLVSYTTTSSTCAAFRRIYWAVHRGEYCRKKNNVLYTIFYHAFAQRCAFSAVALIFAKPSFSSTSFCVVLPML